MTENELLNTLDAHELRLDTQRNRLDVQVERLEKLEERLAAIERAATCGTGPNEPLSFSPARADVGEASAILAKPTPVADCITDAANACCEIVESVFRVKISMGTFRDTINRHVSPELAAKDAENEHLRYAISQYNLCCEQFNIGKLATDDGDSLFEAMCRMEQQLDTLRAEIERLKSKLADAESKAVSATEHHHFYRGKVSDYMDNEVKLNAAITTLIRERDEARERFDEVCVEIRKIEYGQGMSPVGCLRRIATKLATTREAAEAMETWMQNPAWHIWKGVSGMWRCCHSSRIMASADTPTTAILAAKAAGGTSTGEKK